MDTYRMYIKFSPFLAKVKWFWYFIGVYINKNRTLNGCLGIQNFFSHVEKYFSCLLCSLVKYLLTPEDKFCISVQLSSIQLLNLFWTITSTVHLNCKTDREFCSVWKKLMEGILSVNTFQQLRNTCYCSYQWFDGQMRCEDQFYFALTLSPRLYVFLNMRIVDLKFNCNHSSCMQQETKRLVGCVGKGV